MFYKLIQNLRDRSRRAMMLAALAGILVWIGILYFTGVSDAIDRNARRLMYEARGSRSQSAQVIFVAIDERTTESWGLPPWDVAKLDVTLRNIIAGHPRQIAVMEPGPRLLPGAFSKDVQAAIDNGDILMPPTDPVFGQPALTLSDRGAVEAVALGSDASLAGRTVTHTLLTRLGHDTRAEAMPVNFIGRQDALPTLPAELVRRGEVPAKTFAGRVVVIGLRGERFVSSVPTPVGPLSPAEIHAHMLHAVVAEAVWSIMPNWLLAGLCALFAVIGYTLLPRLRTMMLVGSGLGLMLGYGVLVYFAFARYALLLPLGLPLGTFVFSAIAGAFVERRRAEGHLLRLVASAIEHRSGERVWELGELLERFYATSKMYLTFHSSHVTLLEAGKWHVDLHALGNASVADVLERRRDIRREPYASAYATRRPTWSSRPFIDPARGKTLLIPLMAFHRLLGFWMLHVDSGATLSDADRRMATLLASQLALALEQGRIEQHLRQARNIDAATEGFVPGTVAMLQHHSVAVFAQRAQQDRLMDHLPTGLLTASLWGDVVTVNIAMRRILGMAGLERPEGMALAGVVSRLANITGEAARTMLRDIMAQGGFVRMATQLTHANGPATTIEFTLTKIDNGDQDAGGVYVLSAAERRDMALVGAQWQWSAGGDVPPRHMVDVLRVLQDILSEWHGRGGGRLELEMPNVVTPVFGYGDKLKMALQNLVTEVGRGSPDGVGRVKISEANAEVVVRFEGPNMLLPASDVSAIRTGVKVPEHLRPLRDAKDAVESCDGSLSVESTVDAGTIVEVHLHKPMSH